MSTTQTETPDQKELLDRLCAYLKARYGCVTAILYGSRARGDCEPTSDIDVLAFAETEATRHIAHRWETIFLDLFLYPPGTKPEPDWLRLHDGRVLFQRGYEGDEVLTSVQDMVSKGPEVLSQGEAATTRLWLEKMLTRAVKGDAEGDYRRHWLLKDILEIYFVLRGTWYFGPKKSLAMLQDQNPEHFDVFRKAFTPGATMADIQAAVSMTNNSD